MVLRDVGMEESDDLAQDTPVGRRNLLGLAATAFVVSIPFRLASTQAAGDAPTTAAVEQLDNALLAAMKAGGSTPFDDRYRALAPVIERVFDLDAVLADLHRSFLGYAAGGTEGGAGSGIPPPLYHLELRHELQQLQRPEFPGLANAARSRQWPDGGEQQLAARRWFVAGARLRHAPRIGRLAGGGCADRWLDQPCRSAALRFSRAAELRRHACTVGRPGAQGRQSFGRNGRMSSTGSGASLLQRALVRLVDASRGHAWTVVLAGILVAIGSGWYASHYLGVNTDTDQMFSARCRGGSVPWRWIAPFHNPRACWLR